MVVFYLTYTMTDKNRVLVAFLMCLIFNPCALSIRCYTCPPQPCETTHCDGSWCSKLVLQVHSRNTYSKKEASRTVRECVPRDLEQEIHSAGCILVHNEQLQISGRQCYCRSDLCNTTSTKSVNILLLCFAFSLSAFMIGLG